MYIKKEDLIKLYNTHSIEEVCEYLYVSKYTLINLLKENNICVKGRDKLVVY